MDITFVQSVACPLNMQDFFVWYSTRRNAFVVGDTLHLLAYRLGDLSTPDIIAQENNPTDDEAPAVYDERLPSEDYDEWAALGYNGFRYLSRSQYDIAMPLASGRMLNTVGRYGIAHGVFVAHPVDGCVFSLDTGRIEMFQYSDRTFYKLDSARTRGRQAFVYAAHPTERIIVYGTNFGHVYCVDFSKQALGRMRKIASFDTPVSQLTFNARGDELLVGGLGYLARFAYYDDSFVRVEHRVTAIRDFQFFDADRYLLVNHGINGIGVFTTTGDTLAPVASAKLPFSVDQAVLAPGHGTVLVTSQTPDDNHLYFYKLAE